MRTRRQTRNFRELERSAEAQAAAFDDARALALEMGRGVPSRPFDAMSAGLVLLPGEVAYRWIGAWLVVRDAGSWAVPSWAQVLVTDQRLLCRCDNGRLLPLLWTDVSGLQIVLDQQCMLMNYGDEPPILFMGPASVILAVAAVAGVYGVQSLLTHPALSTVRLPRRWSGHCC